MIKHVVKLNVTDDTLRKKNQTDCVPNAQIPHTYWWTEKEILIKKIKL